MLSPRLFPDLLAGFSSRLCLWVLHGIENRSAARRAWLLIRIALFVLVLVLAWGLSSNVAAEGPQA